jgi:hypothetical protein
MKYLLVGRSVWYIHRMGNCRFSGIGSRIGLYLVVKTDDVIGETLCSLDRSCLNFGSYGLGKFHLTV